MGYKFSEKQREKLETIGDVVYNSVDKKWSAPHSGVSGIRHEIGIETMAGEFGIDKITPEDGKPYYVTYFPDGAEISDFTNFDEAVAQLRDSINEVV